MDHWLCRRCAEKLGFYWDPLDDIKKLRLCTNCQVENWVRPFGSSDGPYRSKESPEEIQAAHERACRESEISNEAIKIFKRNRGARNKDEMAEAKRRVLQELEDDERG